MTIEERFKRLERQSKRQRMALIVMAVALCSVVSMAAREISNFDVVRAKGIVITNDKGEVVVFIGADDDGNGKLTTSYSNGEKSVKILKGDFSINNENGTLATMISAIGGGGKIAVFGKTGMPKVSMIVDDNDDGAMAVWKGKNNLIHFNGHKHSR
jgi:hypothetical protein